MEGLSGGGSGGGNMPDLFAKIGPLPAWAWGAIAVAGYLFWSHRQASSVPVATTDTTDTTDAASVPDVTSSNDYGYSSAVDPSSAGYDYGTVNDGSYTGTVTGTAYSSNQAWAVAAIQQLVAAGIPANTATSAIAHYLSGATLTQDEANAVQLAITLLGPAPLPMPVNVSGGSGATIPIPTPTPAPTPEPAPVPVVGTTPMPVTTDPTPAPAPTNTYVPPPPTTAPLVKPTVRISGPTTGKVGQALVYTVTVSGGSGTPTGTVFISPGVEGASLYGTLSGGSAKITYTPTRTQSTTFTGAYEGNSVYDFAQSAPITLNVS